MTAVIREHQVCVGCLIAAIVASVVVKVKFSDPLGCLNDNSKVSCDREHFYRKYGTKTDYLIGRGDVPDDDKPPDRPGCMPVQIYLFSRHAARYPDAEDIEITHAELPQIRDHLLKMVNERKMQLCETAIQEFSNWTLNMVAKDDNRISQSGANQSRDFGERIGRKYPSLFATGYDEYVHVFGRSSRTRTLETASAFAQGLFNGSSKKISPKINEDIVEFHNLCSKHLKKKNYAKTKPLEELLFLNSTAVERTLSDLSKRLHLEVDFDLAKLMLRTCEFEFALFGSSPWCFLFTQSNIKVFEYLEDLNDYYNDGYGVERNYKQACPVLLDIFTNFRLAIENGSRKAILMFSHAGAYKKIVARLSLFKDKGPLLANQYCENQNRKWRSSYICPFNANFYMVLYNCSGNYEVETFFNEKAVQLEGCPSTICPWKDFQNKFKDIVSDEQCNLEKICIP